MDADIISCFVASKGTPQPPDPPPPPPQKKEKKKKLTKITEEFILPERLYEFQ